MTTKELQMFIGKRIKQERKKRGWTTQTLCDNTDISLSGMSKIELGKVGSKLSVYCRIADALDMEVKELFP